MTASTTEQTVEVAGVQVRWLKVTVSAHTVQQGGRDGGALRPIVFIVANNRSIAMRGSYARYSYGLAPESDEPLRYDRPMDALGGRGQLVERPEELRPALERALADRKPALLNVLVDKDPKRKPQEFHWLERTTRMLYQA